VSGEHQAVARVLARAKLTLWFRVLGRRDDGYHDLEAEMVELDLADELTIEPGGTGLSVEFEGTTGTLPAEGDNLVARALRAAGRRANVRLRKRIPIGGGLGGGSADAAAVLRWAGSFDLGVAASLGADVPFCLVGGRARVSGVGERVEPLPPEPREFVLLVPPLAVDTGAVYRAWDSLGAAERNAGSGGNDLEPAALVVEPELARWRDAMFARTGVTPRLAGSGATWFVEGTPADLGLGTASHLEVGEKLGRLLAVRTARAPEAS
jgi:4-diphosphocytidyl-2-C-methyl-D-erythritol kinase